MSDAPARFAERLRAALESGHLRIPQWDSAAVAVEPVGHGESFDIYHLTAPGQPELAVRVARRTELPRPIESEFDNLVWASTVAPGLVPRAWDMDPSAANPLEAPYLVVDYAPGRAYLPEQWDCVLLTSHVERLAELHSHTEGLRPTTRPSGVAWWQQSLEYWQREHPELLTDQQLLARAHRFVLDREDTFDAPHVSALIHGDAVATNIVVGPDGTARLVDWEWSQMGDIARDLALLGGFSVGGPWYVPLDDVARANLVHRYASARGLDSAARTALAARRDVWEVLDRLFTGFWFSTQPQHQAAATQMHAGLRAFLGL